MTPAHALQLYARQDALTDPAGYACLLDTLPAGTSALCEVLSGLIVHTSWADKYDIPPDTQLPRETKSVAERLAEIQQKFIGPPAAERLPTQRPFGTCRDFALMLCSALRHHGIPARVRCGFANYFASAPYADHWICEYWVADEARWAMADAQLDRLQRDQLAITFEPADLPVGAYLTALDAWVRVRSGAARANDFGHGDARGLWFLSVDLHRDVLALANRHMSAWDSWRNVNAGSRHLSDDDLAVCDRLAAVAADAVASGNVAIIEALANDILTPPWRRFAN